MFHVEIIALYKEVFRVCHIPFMPAEIQNLINKKGASRERNLGFLASESNFW